LQNFAKSNDGESKMKNFLKELLSFNLYTGNPIKYRERYSTIAEHEKRLIDEVNGFRKR
jgi:hypothetical protein